MVINSEKGSNMALRISAKPIFMTLALLALASCGNDKKSNSRSEVNRVCEDVSCLASISWKIRLPGRSFPDRTKIDINGATVLNECVSKQKYMIDRYSEPQSLTLDNFYPPKKGDLKIEIVDLGQDCDSYTTFLSNNDVDFTVTKTSGTPSILIDL
jgi:hypothetical protein